MGWLKNLWNRIRGKETENLTLSEGERCTVPNNLEQYTMPNGDEIASKGAQESQISILREGMLNQLGNSAVEFARAGNMLSEEGLLQYAERRGGRPIDISSENKVVERVDVKAAISVGYAVLNGMVDESSIESVGGMAKLIEEV